MKFAVLLLAFVAVQLVVLVICASRIRKAVFRSPLLGAVLVLIVVEALAAISLVLGAYGESRWQAISRLEDIMQEPAEQRPPEIARADNPALLAMLDAQEPALAPPDVTNRETLQSWQSTLRSHLIEDVFSMSGISEPERVDYTVENETTLANGLVRRSVKFSAFDGVDIPAYLFLPRGSGPRPAIVVVPGHVRESESGIAQTAGLVDSYQKGAALELARAGFVTFTFELRGFGPLGAPYHTEHRLVAYNAILAGTFYKAIVSKDLKRAVDLLQSLPQVDASRLGLTGVSYGGELSVAYAALDTRIKAVVFQAYGGRSGGFRGVTGTKKDQPHYCHVIPGANKVMRQEDIFLLLAPRPILGIRGDETPFRDEAFSALLRSAWRAYESPANLELRIEKGGHEYFLEPAITFFRSQL